VTVDAIGELCGKKAVYLPAKDEVLLTSKAFSKDNLYERISALSQIDSADVVVVTAQTILQTVPKKIRTINVQKDGELNQMQTVTDLVSFGYARVETVSSKGTFAMRGDILDVYPVNAESPVRIDFFGDTVEAIKRYDVDTRENLGYVDQVEIPQAVEFCFFDDDINMFSAMAKNDLKNAGVKARARLKVLTDDSMVAMENRDLDFLGAFSVLSKDCATVFDLIDQNSVIIFDEAKRILVSKPSKESFEEKLP
jgi:transcription-repair coupling factor (superfamily II helicase)